MTSDRDTAASWDRVARELRVCKETQQRAWGDVDDSTLGRFLAGEVSSRERAEMEKALHELPELRKLTSLVRDVLDDLEPRTIDLPAPPASVLLPFSPSARPLSGRRFAALWHRHASLVAAACLLVICGLAMPQPAFLGAAPNGEAPRLDNAVAMRMTGALPLLAIDADRAAARTSSKSDPALVAISSDQPQPAAPTLLRMEGGVADSSPTSPPRADELNRRAFLYTARGELVRAVPPLQQAHRICQEKLGINHPATQNSARNLANVYQIALNTADTPVPATCLLREQITNRSAHDVQRAVIPVLIQALKAAPSIHERLCILRALAVLGPAARTALPALKDRLEKSHDPIEVKELLHALNEMGPAARDAVPTLVALSDRCAEADKANSTQTFSKVALKPPAVPQMKLMAHVAASEEQQVRKALLCLCGPEGRSGIDDQAGCFSVECLCRSTRLLRSLAQKSRIEILFETVRTAGEMGKGRLKESRDRVKTMGTRAVHVVFAPQGDAIEVHVSDTLRREGITAEKVRKHLGKFIRLRQYDKAVDDGIRLVMEATAGKK